MMPTNVSETDPIDVSFLDPKDHGLSGRIGLTFAPGKKDTSDRDLDADLDRLRNHHGTDILVSLLEPGDYEVLGILTLPERAVAWGIENVRFPIPDFGVPPAEAMAEFLDLIQQVVEAAKAEKTVVIHCRWGIGRSGTLAASCLVLLGHDPDVAIDRVRRVRPGAVEVGAQVRWVRAVSAAVGAQR